MAEVGVIGLMWLIFYHACLGSDGLLKGHRHLDSFFLALGVKFGCSVVYEKAVFLGVMALSMWNCIAI